MKLKVVSGIMLTLLFMSMLTLAFGGIPAALAAFVPGTGETVKINLVDTADPTASPVTYPDGQAYIELNDTYNIGHSFTVWLNITDVTELRLYGAGVTYDDTVLGCTSYEEGEFFYRADAQYRTSIVNQPILSDGTGFLGYYNHVSWALKKPGNVTGTGTLAAFNFTVVGWGVTKIDIMLSGAQGAVLQDPLDNDIDFNTVDIIFDNTGLAEALTVSLEAPDALEPGESSLLNATVENIGIKNETDVNLQLLINGTAFNSTTIPELSVGSSYTIDYLWTPTTEATYNVTAYAEPVTGETVTENNVATKLVSVYTIPDTTPPTISILSPENKTYAVSTDIALTFTVNEPTSWMGYSLNGQPNVTITENITLPALPDEVHHIGVYANDTAGNMGWSTVYFTVDTTPPNITAVSQTPLENNVQPEDEVKVNATVTDDLSGVKQVTLNYTNGNGTWIIVDMANLEGNFWNATIPKFPYCTNVTYVIKAEDNANNTITTEELEYELQYHVIPEFPIAIILPLFMFSVLIAVALPKKIRCKVVAKTT